MSRYNPNYAINLKIMDIRLSFKEKLYSFIIACFISISLVERVIVYFTNQSYVLFYLAIALFAFMFMTSSKKLKINIENFAILILIIITGIFSITFNGATAIKYLEYCICFYLPAVFIFSMGNIYFNQTLKYINIINLGYLVFYVLLYHSYLISSIDYASLQMEAGYNFIPCILFALISLKYSRTKTIQTIVCLFNLLVSIIYMFLDSASRGPLILIFCFLAIIYIRGQSNIKVIITVVVGLMIAIILIVNYEDILIWFSGVMYSYNIDVPLLDKLILWSGKDYSILNGRDILYENAFEVIRNSPIIGNGIGCFEKYFFDDSLSYVHQYFLQVTCEFGLIGLIGAVIIFVKQLQLILSKKYLLTNNISELEVGFGIVFFCLSMPKLMFSSSYWLTSSFWLLLAWTLSKINLSSRIKIKL